MKRKPLRLSGSLAALTTAALSVPLPAAIVTWDGGAGTSAWSTAGNWDSAEPAPADDVIFPAGLGGAITLATGENAKSLQFDDSYTLSGGGLTLAAAGTLTVANGATATITTPVTLTGGTTKLGAGTLILNGSKNFTGGLVINAGTLRAGHANAIGGTANSATVNSGATLEIGAGITFDRAIALHDGATLQAAGAAISNGIATVAADAAVTLGTVNAADTLTIGNAANDFTGGANSTVTIGGPGAVRLAQNSNYTGAWIVPAGTRLDLVTATSSGATPASGLTLSGGTLAGRAGSGISFAASQAGAMTLTADSTLLSDRSTASAGLTYTFGTLSMGAHTLTVTSGANAASGTAGITLGNVTLAGHPVFAINEPGAAAVKLSTGSLLGGGVARTVLKTGPGDLSITGGATDLAAGSVFTASGAGSIYEFISPATGAANPLVVTAAENALGEAHATITGGTVRLLTNGNGTSTAQTIQLATNFTLGGTVTLDPDRLSAGSSKTFDLPGLTLAAGTDLTMLGANGSLLRLSAPLTLQGSTTLRGSALTSRTGRINVDAGLTGGAGTDTLTLAGGTSPLNLFLNTPGSFPGAVSIAGANVTANAASAFGTGAVSISSGSLTVNAAAALQGTFTTTGGTTRVNDVAALALNPVALNGGTLDFRSNTAATIVTGALILGGDSTINVANNGAGGSQVMTLPALNVTGAPVLTMTNANAFVPLLPSTQLAGDLTINNAITVRSTGITEDASARTLRKSGAGVLELEAAGAYSGGTEILGGTLQVEHADALGSGAVTLGDTAGSTAATLRLSGGLTVGNDLTVRAGSSGVLAINAAGTLNHTLTGDITLQRGLTIDNDSSGPLTFSGRINGPHDVTYSGSGQTILTNGANDFGTGGPASLNVLTGTVAIGSDAPLGAGGLSIGPSGRLRITESFATSRLITLAAGGGMEVDAAKMLTLNAALPADVLFSKFGPGTLSFGPAVVSTRTTGATLSAGTLRLTGAHGLSTGGTVTMSTGTRLELMNDSNTAYPQGVASTASAAVTVHTGGADGGSATGGTHSIGPVALNLGSFTHTSAGGFGLSTGALSTTGSFSLLNDGTGPLTLAALNLGGTTTSARTMTVETNGADIRVTGALTQTGTPIYNLTKRGAHTLRLESGLGLTGAVSVAGGTLDLHNTSNTIGGLLTLAGENPATPVLLQSGAGTLTLGGNVTLSTSFIPPVATIAGAALDLGGADRTFTVPNSTAPGPDLEITSPITGGAGLVKISTGVLRLSGTGGNTFSGLTRITDGTLELFKTAGNAIGAGGLEISGTSVPLTVLLASHQIADTAPVLVDAVTTGAQLDLAGFAETTGALTIRSTDTDGARLTTGAAGVLTLNADLTLANNRDSTATNEREVLLTGTGTEFAATSTGTLDLGGVNRVITTGTTVAGANAAYCHATIETVIRNGGIVKRGPQTLFLPNPGNTFAGGVRIEEGCVDFGGTGSPGPGGITLAPAAGTTACFNFTGAGSSAASVTLAGDPAGTAKITYGGAIGESYTLSAPLSLATQPLTVEVIEGTNLPDTAATLHLTGAISGAHGLLKTGSGILTLTPGNTHTGTTVQRGVLKVSADSALGLSAGALTVNGGCFHADEAFTLTRPLVFGASGGCVRVDGLQLLPDDALTVPDLTWSDAAHGFFGGGSVILSGATVAGNGSVTVGAQTVFADDIASTAGSRGTVLSLRGAAALPAGNLSLVNDSVLELGNGDFTRALGTGAGQVQLPTRAGAGFAAHGADRTVNLGGAGATLVWGSNSALAPFLNLPGGSLNSVGDLWLGSATATHTVIWQNPLQLENGGGSFLVRDLYVPDGPAALEARITGGITYTPAGVIGNATLNIVAEGNLEIASNITGPVSLSHGSQGTVTFSGTNTLEQFVTVETGGKFVFTSNAAAGSPDYIVIGVNSEIDGSALASPWVQHSEEVCDVNGTLRGSLTTGGALSGNGLITGSVIVNAGTFFNDGVYPTGGGAPLRIGGDFTLQAGGVYHAWAYDLPPNTGYSQISVTGAVNLAGTLILDYWPDHTPAAGDTYFLLLNAGNDAISGTFDGLPEGSTFTDGDGTVLAVTYTANGDGGPVGNDFALTVIFAPPPPSDEVTIVNITQNPATCQMSLTIATDIGQDYLFEVSEDLENWATVESFTGDGTNHIVTSPVTTGPRQFLRVSKASASEN